MSDTDDLVPHGSRRQRRERRRHRHEIVAGVVAVALAVGAALVLTDTVRLPSADDKPAVAENRSSTRPSSDLVQTSPSSADSAPPRALTLAAPLKLWIGGDSLAWAPGISLGQLTGKTGVVQPYLDSRTSSGLTSPSFYDWKRHGAEEMAAVDPDAVIFTVGANDTGIVQQNPRTLDGQPAWKAKWRDLVGSMMDLFIGGSRGRHVYWVGAPVMSGSSYTEKVRQLDDIAREEASKRSLVTYVDGYQLFSDAAGRYASSLPDDTGKRILVRAGDGIHFTGDGGDRLAAVLYRALDAYWKITKQVVPGHLRKLIESKGSTPQPGKFVRSTKSTATATSASSAAGTGSGGTSGTSRVVTTTPGTAASGTSSATSSTAAATSTTAAPSTTQATTTTSAATTSTAGQGQTQP